MDLFLLKSPFPTDLRNQMPLVLKVFRTSKGLPGTGAGPPLGY
jgi:hypothetical protein